MAFLWEALKSGKRFRNAGWPLGDWYDTSKGEITFTTAGFNSDLWIIEEDPKPRPRRLAWISKDPNTGSHDHGFIRLLPENCTPVTSKWERYERFDEPEVPKIFIDQHSGVEIK